MKHYTFGHHAVYALLSQRPEVVSVLFVQQGRHDQRRQDLLAQAKLHAIEVQAVPKQVLSDRLGAVCHQGVMAEHEVPVVYNEKDLPDLLALLAPNAAILVLDQVQDPRNLGACLRTADAAGVSLVVFSKHGASQMTATVRKVACGAAEALNLVQVTNLVRALRQMQQQGVWIYGACGEAPATLYEQAFSGPTAFVLGAEGAGLRRLTRDACDVLVQIPMVGTVSSLNVSVATGLCLYEWLRQQD